MDAKPSNELDLVFCCDCTSSMGSYIESAKQNIRTISDEMHAMEARDMRYGLVCYRDHPPQDSTYATKVFPLTPSIQVMQQNVNTMAAQGVGDGPESVACALHDALTMDYRKNSVRVCVIIADAPPHGLGEQSDGFPNGCPCGHDPLAIARKMAENKIIIYCVACEPNLGYYKNARAFYKGIADLTHGRYLSLGNAHLLPKVIVGGSAEELDLKKFETEVATETSAVKSVSPALSASEVEEKVWSNLQSEGVKTWQLDVTHQSEKIDNSDYFMESPSLAEARTSIPVSAAPAPAPTPFGFGGSYASASRAAPPSSSSSSFSFGAPASAAPTSYASQSATYYNAPISREQVSKVMKRNAES